MNLNQLRVFAAVAAEGNVTRAASRLSISQPAASKQLAELERALGVQLVERRSRGVRLTEAGSVLQRHAERILAIESSAQAELEALGGLRQGRLAVGACMVAAPWLPAALARLHAHHPELELRLVAENAERVQEAVARGELEAAVVGGFVGREGLEPERLGEVGLALLAPVAHPLRGARIEAGRLTGQPFVIREPGASTRGVVEATLARRRVRFSSVLVAGSPGAVVAAVEAGLGLAFVPRALAHRALRGGRVAELELVDLELRLPLHWVMRKGATLGAAMQRLRALVVSTAR